MKQIWTLDKFDGFLFLCCALAVYHRSNSHLILRFYVYVFHRWCNHHLYNDTISVFYIPREIL